MANVPPGNYALALHVVSFAMHTAQYGLQFSALMNNVVFSGWDWLWWFIALYSLDAVEIACVVTYTRRHAPALDVWWKSYRYCIFHWSLDLMQGLMFLTLYVRMPIAQGSIFFYVAHFFGLVQWPREVLCLADIVQLYTSNEAYARAAGASKVAGESAVSLASLGATEPSRGFNGRRTWSQVFAD